MPPTVWYYVRDFDGARSFYRETLGFEETAVYGEGEFALLEALQNIEADGSGNLSKSLAGVGNVYRAEILFRHRVSPFRLGQHVDADLWARMWTDLVKLMKAGGLFFELTTGRPYNPTSPFFPGEDFALSFCDGAEARRVVARAGLTLSRFCSHDVAGLLDFSRLHLFA